MIFSTKVTVISLIVCLFIMPNKYGIFDSELNIILSCVSLINVFFYFKAVNKFYQSWFRYDVLFIIGFLIVHFQIPFLESIGISPSRPDFIWINKEVVNFATWFSTLALLLWMFGVNIYILRKKPIEIKRSNYIVEDNWIFDFVLFSSFILFLVLVGESFFKGNHAGSYNWGAGASYAFLILKLILTLSIIYFFLRNKGKILLYNSSIYSIISRNKLLFIISILYCTLFLLVGDRGPVMELGITYLVGYSLFQKKITLFKLTILLLVASTVFTIIKYGRTRDVSSRDGNIITSGYNNFIDDENPFNPTNELASSVRILYRALDVVPDLHPYLYGTSLFSNIVDVVPLSSTFYEVPPMYGNSTTFFTVLGQGEFYTYGEGSEIIADLYINIGFWFTLIVFFIFGYFISFFTYSAHKSQSHYILLVYFIITAGAVYINRSNFLNPLKMIIYVIIFDKVFAKRTIVK